MTCNLKKTYEPKSTITIPVYSRLRPDLIFKENDNIEIFAFPQNRPVKVEWKLCKNMFEQPFLHGEGELGMDHSVKITVPAKPLSAGFYDLYFTIYATTEIKETGKTVFGYNIKNMPITESKPTDFSEFWQLAITELETVKPNPKITFVRNFNEQEIDEYNSQNASLPGNYDPEGYKYKNVKLYQIEFDSLAKNGTKRYYGWIAVPDSDKKLPGLLVLPGAGCNALPAPLEQARHGYVALMLHIHGMKPNLDKYKRPAKYLNGKTGRTIKDDYYYYTYLACVQATNILEQHEAVIADKLAVCGGSQGGLLAIVTAALCPQIKAAVAAICYYGYWPFRDYFAEQNNKTEQPIPDKNIIPFDRNNRRQNHLSYYDAMNFSTLIKSPILMLGCLCDNVSPATSVWAVFNSLKSKKKSIIWSVGTDHDLVLPFEQAGYRWLNNFL